MLLDTLVEINQILLKIYFIHILLTFMYLVTLYQKSELQTNPSQLNVELNSSSRQKVVTITISFSFEVHKFLILSFLVVFPRAWIFFCHLT